MTGKGNFKPAYAQLGEKALRERARRARGLLSPCRLCPRECGVDRINGELGFCKTTVNPIISSRHLHFGEEPAISGHGGSGTIFFSRCNMRCVFCQNYPISQLGAGETSTVSDLADMMLYLQNKGAHNINFVTPSHVVHAILGALAEAYKKGLNIPLVYNSGGYDSIAELELLDSVVDIYMPDAKYSDNKVAKRLSNVDNYVEVNRAALKEMHRQVGVLQMDEEGVAYKGLLIRHLVLPEGLAGSEQVIKFIAEEISPDTYVSLLSQYFPANKAAAWPELDRPITKQEYRKVLTAMENYNLTSGFIQG